MRALLPVATLYVGKLIIDEVVLLSKAPHPPDDLRQWLASGLLDRIAWLLAFEFALAVADDFQRRGLGRYLVKRLLATTWRRGVRRLYGEIECDNRAMLAFAMQLGFRLRGSLEDQGVVIASSVAPSRADWSTG